MRPAIHTMIILAGLYFFGVQDMATVGLFLVAAGIVALGYGAANVAAKQREGSGRAPGRR